MDNAFNAPLLVAIGVAILLTVIVTVPWLVTLGFFCRGMLAEWRKQRKQHRARHDAAVPPHRT